MAWLAGRRLDLIGLVLRHADKRPSIRTQNHAVDGGFENIRNSVAASAAFSDKTTGQSLS